MEEEEEGLKYGCFRDQRAGWEKSRRKGDRRKGRQRDEGSWRGSREREEEEESKTKGEEERKGREGMKGCEKRRLQEGVCNERAFLFGSCLLVVMCNDKGRE